MANIFKTLLEDIKNHFSKARPGSDLEQEQKQAPWILSGLSLISLAAWIAVNASWHMHGFNKIISIALLIGSMSSPWVTFLQDGSAKAGGWAWIGFLAASLGLGIGLSNA